MKKIILLIILAVLFNGANAQSVFTDSLTGIEVSFITDDEMFPASWRSGNINGYAVSLDTSEYERSKKIISAALAKYPKEVLKKNLKKVYVLKSLHFYNVGYGGTNSTDAVYVTNKGANRNYSSQYIEQVFHAELSSILLRNYTQNIDESEWSECHDQEFVYGGAGHEAIRSGKASEYYDSAYHEMGFLNQYATSNFENDLNSFAKNIFAPDPEFWTVCNKYENVKCKLKKAILFYRKINPVFTEEYFKKWE